MKLKKSKEAHLYNKKSYIKLFFLRFGLEKCNFERIDKSLLNPNYKDRANDRREKFGIDFSHVPVVETHQTTSEPISTQNVGFKLMAKMGWQEGTGLGKSQTGIVEPITATVRIDRAGLGAGNSAMPIDGFDESKKKKILIWNKINQRYQKANVVGAAPALFNIDDDDEDEMEKETKATISKNSIKKPDQTKK